MTVEGIPEDEIVKMIGFSDLGEIEREREICIGAEDDRQSRKCGLDRASRHRSVWRD